MTSFQIKRVIVVLIVIAPFVVLGSMFEVAREVIGIIAIVGVWSAAVVWLMTEYE